MKRVSNFSIARQKEAAKRFYINASQNKFEQPLPARHLGQDSIKTVESENKKQEVFV